MSDPGLRPLSGTPRQLIELLRHWLDAPDPVEPLSIATSGSTGTPKHVMLSRSALLASAEATHVRLAGPGQWLLNVPPTHVAGLQVLLRSLLAGHQPVIATEHDSFSSAVAAMSAETKYVSLVPTQLHRMAAADSLDVLRTFDVVLLGGAHAPKRLLESARAAGVRIVRTYGMSETSGGCVYDGLPLDGVELRLDEERRVEITGSVLFDGYADDPAATAEVLHNGWFRTSDIAEFDADGCLRIIGRVDDVVISGGVNVALPAVAEAIRELGDVDEVTCVGVDDAEWGTRVVACVVGTASLDQLRDAVSAAGLPRTWAPRQLVTLDAFPLLSNGKTDRLALRRLATGETS